MRIEIASVPGIGEVRQDTDLVNLVGKCEDLKSGDIVVLTSKIVSKAEGRVRRTTRDEAVASESVRTVARRGATTIAENRLGLIMAAAGVDASNVQTGHVVLLPLDPDSSARRIRDGVLERFGCNIGVLITDTAGRAWRNGQTDIAIGVAGLEPLEEFSGHIDSYGNELAVTAPAVADEIAGISEVASGKLGRQPMVVVRGLEDRVLAAGQHGPGAAALIRHRDEDMFGVGTREAVILALSGSDPSLFGRPATAYDLTDALLACGLHATLVDGTLRVPVDPSDAALKALALAHGWLVEECAGAGGMSARLSPRPTDQVDSLNATPVDRSSHRCDRSP